MAELKIKKIERPKYSLWEKAYFPEIFRGLFVTSSHFFKNIILHILHLFGIAKDKRAGVTFQYPEERRPLCSIYRTRHRLMKREDGSPKCVACFMCATICPDQCIHIVAKESPDKSIEKMPEVFDIDILRCCFCGMCVEACPVDAIRMDTGIVEMADYNREPLIYDIKYLLEK